VARSQSGKTSLLIRLIKHKWAPLFNKIYIFCPTYSLDKKWSEIDIFVKSGKVNVYGTVKQKILGSIWQKSADRKIQDDNYKTLVVFDDCMGQKDFKTNSDEGIVNKLVCKGNHANISTVWSIQKLTMCSTIMRSQVEGIVVFFCQEKELKILHQEFGTGSLKWFRKLVESATSRPYASLFINRQGSGKPRYFCNFKEIILESIKE
jgi:hypothetical protein